MRHTRESLARALERVAGDVADAIAEASDLHTRYATLCHAASDDHPLDEVHHRRAEAGLYATRVLVDQLRAAAHDAATRFPAVDRHGEPIMLPPVDHPAEVRDWWDELTDEERQDIIEQHPLWVGSADGLPIRVRHNANLRLLDEELERRADLINDEEAEPVEEADARAQRDVRGLLKIKALFSAQPDEKAGDLSGVTTPLSQRFLYLLDAHEYPLKTAIWLGDEHRADHVVVHVPGATTTVDMRLIREMTWMSNLRTEAGKIIGDVERVAILDWMGYQAPLDIATRRALGDSGVSVLVPGQAADPQYARAAAPYLARCGEGVRAICGPQVRLVASGHSYGASVFGLALQETSVFDAAMAAGCPGLFVTSISELKIPQNRLYAAVNPGDVVALLNFFGIQVIQIPGVQILAPTPRATSYKDGTRALLKLTVGHETYYDLGSVTLNGLAAIVVGDLNRIKTVSLAWLSRLTGIGSNATVVAPVLNRSSG